MPWTAAAIVGAAAIGAGASSYSANEAENAQSDSAKRANATQSGMFNTTQANLQPWLTSGGQARDTLGVMAGQQMSLEQIRSKLALSGKYPMGDATIDVDAKRIFDQQQSDPNTGKLLKPFGMEDFQASPAYKFNLEQGQMAIDKAAAARGKFYAPATLQDVSKFSQGLASNEFQNSYNNYNNNMKNIWDRLYSLSGQGQNAAANLGGFGTTVAGQIGQNQIGAGNAAAAGQVGQGNAVSQGLGSIYNGFLTQQILSSNQGSSYNSGGSNFGSAGAGDLSFSGMA